MPRSRALSPQAQAVVVALAASDDWRHGYDLMAQAGVKSGTLYPLLMRLEAQGMLQARWVAPVQPGRPARHVYKLTQAGREWVASVVEPQHALPGQAPAFKTAASRS
jgi:DNA-binding PadR family transcriptional regulator